MTMTTRVRAALISLIGFALVLSLQTAQAAPRKPVMVGYIAAFKGIDMTIARTRLDDYTHFNIAFANPDANGIYARDGQLTCMPAPFGAATGVAELRAQIAKLRAKGAKVLVSVGGVHVLIDPMFSERAGRIYRRSIPPGLVPSELPPLAALLVTHSHYNHLDAPSVRAVGRDVPVCAPLGLASWFRCRGFVHVHELGWMEAQQYATLARQSVEDAVAEPLRKYGIVMP